MKTIKLKTSGLGRYEDVSPFVMSGNALELAVDFPDYNGEFCLVTDNNGAKTKHLLIKGEAVSLSGLTAGELKAEVKHYLKGVLVKSYKIEPLILIEADGTLTGTPEITVLSSRCAALEKELAATNKALQSVIAELTRTNETLSAANTAIAEHSDRISKLTVFAYADYKNNVYLGGGSAEEFEREYGLTVGDDKGEKDNDEA